MIHWHDWLKSHEYTVKWDAQSEQYIGYLDGKKVVYSDRSSSECFNRLITMCHGIWKEERNK